MKNILALLLLGSVHVFAAPVLIEVDSYSTNAFRGSSSASGTNIVVTDHSTVTFQDQSDPDSASISLDATSILNFAQISATTYSGLLTGTGTVEKTGSGNLTITGNNAAFTGPLLAQAGTLFLNGAYGGNVTASPSATIVYKGPILGDLHVTGTITTEGTSTLLVGGNYLQDPSGIYRAIVNSSGQSSLINIGGTSTLNGFLQIDASQGVLVGRTYTILHATGGVIGTLQVINSYPSIVFFLTSDPNNLFLSFHYNISATAKTPNQKRVANVFDYLVPTTPDENLLLSTLLTLSSNDTQNALNQLSAEHYSNFVLSTLYDMGRFSKTIFNSLRDLVYPCTKSCERLDGWLEIGGGKGYQKGNKANPGFHLSSFDVTFGMHSCVKNAWRIGGALRYDNDFVYSNLHGKATLKSGGASLYSLFQKGRFFFLGDVIGERSWGEFQRPLLFGSINRTAHSDPRLASGRLDLQFGIDVGLCSFALQPYLGLSAEIYHQEKVKEHGADAANITLHSITKKLASSQIGIHSSTNRKEPFTIFMDFAWQHYYGRLRVNETTRFQEFGAPFLIEGPKRGHDGALLDLTFIHTLGKSWEMYLGVEGELWKRWHAFECEGGVNYRW
jgi:outer membrane autotransporter protein